MCGEHPCIGDYLEAIVFFVGFIYLLRWVYFLSQTIRHIFFGVKVTTDRYGKGTWAIVTGGTDGIGKAIAEELALRGFNLLLISRSMDKLQATAAEIKGKAKTHGQNIDTRVISFDFASDLSMDAYVQLAKKFSDLDVSILVNNVGCLNTEQNLEPENVYQEVALNCYPITLLT